MIKVIKKIKMKMIKTMIATKIIIIIKIKIMILDGHLMIIMDGIIKIINIIIIIITEIKVGIIIKIIILIEKEKTILEIRNFKKIIGKTIQIGLMRMFKEKNQCQIITEMNNKMVNKFMQKWKSNAVVRYRKHGSKLEYIALYTV